MKKRRKKETDVTNLASRLTQEQERPMDSNIDDNVASPEQWYGSDRAGAFGPMAPMQPSSIGGDPRQWEYKPAWNLPTSPNSDRGSDTTFLRTLADTYDLLRKCIEIRKFEMCSLEWDIIPKEKNKKKSAQIHDQNADLINEIKAFFTYPEAYMDESPSGQMVRKPIRTFDEWLSALLEDYFVLDAMTIYPRPKRNGELLALERIDGATIKPLLTIDGRVPLPPAPAYQQYLYGMPRASLSLKQLYYKPKNVRNHTPYGFSHVEQAMTHINLALRTETWYTSYFTHGSIPEGLLTMPENMTPDQMWNFVDRLNQVAGNPKAMRQFMPVPNGSSWLNLKDFTFDDSLMNYIVTMTCTVMDIQPMELGFMHGSHGLGGSGFADGQEVIHHRKSLIPLGRWLESIFTQIIHDWWGNYDLEFSFTTLRDVADIEQDRLDIDLVKSGLKSIDEYVMERGGEPPGIGRMMIVGSEVFFEPDLVKGTKEGMTSLGEPPPDNSEESEDDEGKQPNQEQPPPEKNDNDNKGMVKLIEALLLKSIRDQENDNSSDDSSDDDDSGWFSTLLLSLLSRAKAFKLNRKDSKEIEDQVLDLKKKSYLQAINDQLRALGFATISKITDTKVLKQLQKEASQTAKGIFDTLKQNISDQTKKLDPNEMKQWLIDHGDWKGKQITATESNKSYTDGQAAFLQNNGIGEDASYMVEPDNCVCDACKSLVAGSPYQGQEGMDILARLPLHPNCVHEVRIEYGDSVQGLELDPESIWNGGDDDGS